MTELLSFTIVGLITGTAYAGAACGLILIYKTTRVFNLAHGAIGMVMTFVFWQLTVAWGLPAWAAVPAVLLLIAPGFGVVIERVVTRGLGAAPVGVAMVVTAGLFVGLIGLAQALWPPQVRSVPLFFGNAGLQIGEVFVAYHGIVAITVVACVATGMSLMLTRTRIGASMRASVHDPQLLAIFGGRPHRASMLAWALGSAVSALAGILLSPLLSVDYYELALVVMSAFAAAIFGRLTSMRLAFVGAMVLGLAQAYAVGYLPAGQTALGVRAAIPALLMLVALAFLRPARPELGRISWGAARSLPVPSLRRTILVGALVIAAAAGAAAALETSNVILVAEAFCLGMIGLSLVLLTGYGGHVSLAHLAFAGIGAAAVARFAGPSLPAALFATVATIGVGALVAMLVLRLSGLYLAIATLAFALLMDKLVFQAPFLFGPNGSVAVPHLSIFGLSLGDERGHLVLVATVFVLMAVGLLAVRRGRVGRLLIAMRDNPAACATLGLDPRWFRVALFAASAGMAGLAGALMAGLRPTVVAAEYQVLAGLPLLVLVAVCGVTSATGALAGGFLLMLLPVLQSSLPELGGLAYLLIGIGAVVIGRDPDGLANLAFKLGHWVRLGGGGGAAAAVSVPASASTLVGPDEPDALDESDAPDARDEAAALDEATAWKEPAALDEVTAAAEAPAGAGEPDARDEPAEEPAGRTNGAGAPAAPRGEVPSGIA